MNKYFLSLSSSEIKRIFINENILEVGVGQAATQKEKMGKARPSQKREKERAKPSPTVKER